MRRGDPRPSTSRGVALAAAAALLDSIDAPASPADRAFQQPSVDRARAAVDERTWQTATSEGVTASLERAIAYGCEPALAAAGPTALAR